MNITDEKYSTTATATTAELLRRTGEWIEAGQLSGDRLRRAFAAWTELNRRGYSDEAIREASK